MTAKLTIVHPRPAFLVSKVGPVGLDSDEYVMPTMERQRVRIAMALTFDFDMMPDVVQYLD